MKKIFFFVLFIAPVILFGQKTSYQVAMIGFYNCENFYDTVDNPIVNDEEFLPNGPKHYNSSVYWNKVEHLATVLSKIGTDVSGLPNPDGLSLIGVAEIENDSVLTDLVNHQLLKSRGYKIVHYDSRDARGVDVALLYNPKRFVVEKSDKLFVQLPSGSKDAWYTRDVLWVRGKLDGETIDVYVNHWPSRSGGEERSAPARAAAASVVKRHMDSVNKADGYQKVVIMGDLNDDPVSPSVAHVLDAKGKAKDVREGGLFNPWVDLYKSGIGTLAYQDNWNLFDQIMISYPWLDKEQKGYFFYKNFIFNREFLMENTGRYKGYPMRTWDGNSYRGGYSDHFPTYIVLLKKIDPSQSTSTSKSSEEYLLQVAGGMSVWKRFLEKYLNDRVAEENGARPGKYTAIVSFTIDTSGNVTDVRLEKDPGYGVGAEAVRVMKKSPKWTPATKDGIPVNYRQKQSITIVYDEM